MQSTTRSPGLFGSRRAVAITALVCIALMLVSANIIIARFFSARLDLTAEHLYTLSPGTVHTLAQIDEPITLRFYYSNRLGDEVPAYGVYAQRVRELLEQYVAAAHGKLRLEIFNPQPFSDVEDQAVAFGLQAVPLDSEGDQVYFGLAATNSTDDQQVIAFFSPERERFLEYDLTKLIHSLAFPKKTVVGLISSLPLEGDMAAMMQGRPSQPMAVIEQLQQLDKIEPLSASLDAIPADVDVLMLVHPQNLPPKTLFAIDQFVLKGGKALIFVDPHSELQAAQASQMNPPGSPTASNLAPLFKSWGFRDAAGGRRRRPARCPAGQRTDPRTWRGAARLHRLARSAFEEPQSQRYDHRRSEPPDDGLGRHHRAAARSQDDARAADRNLARTRPRSRSTSSKDYPTLPACLPISSPTTSATSSPPKLPAWSRLPIPKVRRSRLSRRSR